MKKIMLVVCILGMLVTGISQNRAVSSKEKREIGIEYNNQKRTSVPFTKTEYLIIKSTPMCFDDEQVGYTKYDNQTKGSADNRIYFYDDGSFAVTWNFGMFPSSNGCPDRGTGYNYFDGNTWDPMPEERIEPQQCGWPSYAPLGENGELIVSHKNNSGLMLSTRENKGTGEWQYSALDPPTGCPPLLWNNTITSGPNHNRIHILAATYPGLYYQGLMGAILYSLSTDGGASWEIENVILDGMTADDFYAFQGDMAKWAKPLGDTLAFVAGDEATSLVLMKSLDGGLTFDKTLIQKHPYPNLYFGMETDTFYCADQSHSVALDMNGMAHVTFGIMRALWHPSYTVMFPFVDGIGYWNESMPTFTGDINALSPYGEPGSEMIEDYNLIGWSQDVDGDGELTFLTNVADYYQGLSSMTQLIFDEQNHLYLIYSSITETFSNGIKNYRHLWSRSSLDGGNTWGDFIDLNADVNYYFTENVFPSCAKNSDEYIYLIYQSDNQPGIGSWWQHPYHENEIRFMKVLKAEISTGVTSSPYIFSEDVSQNYPNPFNEYSYVNINLRKACNLKLLVKNMIGQVMYEKNLGYSAPGMNKISINGINLSSGIYFYTVKAGSVEVTKKMIVK